MGFEKAGFKVMGYEWKKEIQENANKINGLDIRHADIFSDEFIPRLEEDIADRKVTVIVGGPPCQSFSAGNTKGKGEKDERNGIGHFLSIVKNFKPIHFIMENAPTLKTGEKHRLYFKKILEEIKEMGYKCKAKVVDMSYFRVPQKRRRTIIFGTLDDRVFTFLSLNNLTATQMPVKDVLTRKEIESVTILDYGVEPINSNFNNTSVNSENVMSRLPLSVLQRMRGVEEKKMRIIDITKPSNTLTITSCQGASLKGYQNTGARFLLHRTGGCNMENPFYNVMSSGKISSDEYESLSKEAGIPISVYTPWELVDEHYHPPKDKKIDYNHGLYVGAFYVIPTFWGARGLTVHEMRRIQTFPDTYTFHNTTMPKTRKLAETIIGNSVPPNFAYVLASRLLMKKDEEIIKELGPPEQSALRKKRKIGEVTEILLKLKF
jgi:DNA-cytosine methyltransferase